MTQIQRLMREQLIQQDDESIVKRDDTRKTRLTLKMINKARRAAEFHEEEKEKELEFIRQMYGVAAQPEV